MKKRVIKKQFNKIAKKSIKDNSYLFNKYGVNSIFIHELKLYLNFILNAKGIKKEIHYEGSLKLFLNNCIEDTENFIYNKILRTIIRY